MKTMTTMTNMTTNNRNKPNSYRKGISSNEAKTTVVSLPVQPKTIPFPYEITHECNA